MHEWGGSPESLALPFHLLLEGIDASLTRFLEGPLHVKVLGHLLDIQLTVTILKGMRDL